MNVELFYQSRRDDWQALTELLDRSRAGMHQLSPEEVQRLGALYRAATSDLALAQRDFPGHRVTVYLNQLVGRAHALVYRGEPMAGNRFVRFVRVTFPRTFRENWPFILTAALLMLIPAILAGLSTAWRPESSR